MNLLVAYPGHLDVYRWDIWTQGKFMFTQEEVASLEAGAVLRRGPARLHLQEE